MGITSLQVCMDSSDWLQQGLISKENIGGLLDSPPTMTTTPPVDPHDPDILMCGGHPLAAERRLRPHHEQALKCPRCDSTHTKFCYYNNYSLSQPRYFCKACRRYWTKGGTLRNIPVGGGCRKNKKISSNTKKAPLSASASISPAPTHDPIAHRATGSPPLVLDAKSTELQLAFPEQLRFAAAHGLGSFDPLGGGLFFEDVGPGPGPIGSCMGINRYDEGFMGMHQNTNFNGMEIGSHAFGMPAPFDGGIHNPAGLSIVESCQRLMMPYDDIAYHGYDHTSNHHHHHDHREDDVKPSARVLSLEWHDCISDVGVKDAFGYNIGGLGSWATNGYGSSAMNPMV